MGTSLIKCSLEYVYSCSYIPPSPRTVFAPLPVNFTVEVSSTQPAITLYWDNPFDSLPPDQLILTTVATKLSGTPLTENTETLTLTLADLTSGIGFDSSYTLSNLQFYSNYSISLAAVYSGETSTAIVREATTIQGGKIQTLSKFEYSKLVVSYLPKEHLVVITACIVSG